MAFPTIQINNSTGSNTTASGAGPATAVTGTAATVTNGSSSISITDAVSLSGVAVDGSAAIYVATSSGRKFSQITAISGSSGAWTVTVTDTVWTAGTFSWAIGGKRLDFETTNSNTKQAFSDFHAGWTIDIQNANINYVVTSKVVLAPSDVGAQTIITSSSSTAPTITTATNSVNIFSIEPTVSGNGNLVISNLKFTNTATTKAACIIAGLGTGVQCNSLELQNIIVDLNANTGSVNAIDFTNRPPINGVFNNVTTRNFMGYGIYFLPSNSNLFFCTFLGATGSLGGAYTASNGTNIIIGCNFNNCGIGVQDADTSHNGVWYLFNNSFRNCTTGANINKGTQNVVTIRFTNNAFWNCTTGISITTGNSTSNYIALTSIINCAFGSCTTTIDNTNIPIYITGPTITSDPWPNAANGDFRAAGGTGIQAAAWPSYPTGYPGIINGADIGAVQHPDPAIYPTQKSFVF